MKKRLMCMTVVFAILFVCLLQLCPVRAKAEVSAINQCGINVQWDLDEGTGVLTISGSGAMYDYKNTNHIPWRSRTDYIKKIVVQPGITRVGMNCFYACNQATSVSLPESLEQIGEQAFHNCFSLEQLNLPSGLKRIDDYAFDYCSGLKSVSIPESVTSCGKGIFTNCRGLSTFDLPSGWKEIPPQMFERSGLREITIPASIEKIGYRAFDSCTALMIVHFKGSAPVFENMVFMSVKAAVSYPASDPSWTADVLQNYDGTLTWYPDSGSGPRVSGTYVNLDWEMKGNTLYITQNPYVQSGYYPSNPEWLTYRGLIEKVVMSGKIETVSFSFFEGCIKLKEIQWPTGLKYISDDAFKGCTALESITFPDSVEYIGSTAFALCKNLKTVVLPKNLSSLGYWVFRNCTGLESITIPACVSEMGRSVFEGCTSLKTIYFASYMPKFMVVERTPASVIRPGVIQPAAYEPGTFSQIGSAVTVYYPENELTWTADALQTLKDQYADEKITFAAYRPGTQEPEKTPAETTGPADKDQPEQNDPQSNPESTGPGDTPATGEIQTPTDNENPEIQQTVPDDVKEDPAEKTSGAKWWIIVVIVAVVAAGAAGAYLFLKKKK